MNFTKHFLLIAVAVAWTTNAAEEQVTGLWKLTIERKVEGELVFYCEKYVDLNEAPHYLIRYFEVRDGTPSIRREIYRRNRIQLVRSSERENWGNGGSVSLEGSLESHKSLRRFIVLAETPWATELNENPFRPRIAEEIKLFNEFHSNQIASKDPVVISFGDGTITWTAHRGILLQYKQASENEVYSSTAQPVERFPLDRNDPI